MWLWASQLKQGRGKHGENSEQSQKDKAKTLAQVKSIWIVSRHLPFIKNIQEAPQTLPCISTRQESHNSAILHVRNWGQTGKVPLPRVTWLVRIQRQVCLWPRNIRKDISGVIWQNPRGRRAALHPVGQKEGRGACGLEVCPSPTERCGQSRVLVHPEGPGDCQTLVSGPYPPEKPSQSWLSLGLLDCGSLLQQLLNQSTCQVTGVPRQVFCFGLHPTEGILLWSSKHRTVYWRHQ